MEPERWQTIKKILDDAAAAPAAERRAVIAAACGEDRELLREVEGFLELDDEIDEFIEEPLWNVTGGNGDGDGDGDREQDSSTGRRVGPYRIRRLLGRGGMGAVFLAVREDDFRQKVALKVVDWGAGSDEIVARFLNERQILANLQHPGIARLLDGGTTDDGIPYFAMEYVEGEPIDRYCDRHDLPIRERLKLFRKVCAAVHFAHQSLVVHRDLKAGNILVTDDGTPRLLDFGIAKLLQPELASRPLATAAGRTPMTPAYASPEQILNEPITTACDVYALGVLLYRLLAGRLPYSLQGKGYAEMVNVICLREPEPPSAAVGRRRSEREESTVIENPWLTSNEAAVIAASAEDGASAAMPAERRRLRRALAGDLDAIVAKAMRKEARHRYGSAAELSEDIRRHLAGLPVGAHKGTWLYHAGKFIRRNKLAIAVMALVSALAVTSTYLWLEADDERAQAVRERTRAERVTELLEGLFESADPNEQWDPDVTVREILEHGEQKIAEELEEEPEIRAEFLGTLGIVYKNLGDYDRAQALMEEALRARRAADPRDSPNLAKDVNNLAAVYYAKGDYRAAEAQFHEVLAMRRRLGQSDSDIDTSLYNLAATLNHLGRFDEARRLHREAIRIRTAIYGPESSEVASSRYSLGALELRHGELAAAELLLSEALERRAAIYGSDHPRVVEVQSSLAQTLHARGDLAAARSLYEQALRIRRQRLDDDHPTVAKIQRGLAAVLLDQGEVEAAGALIHKALDTLRTRLPEDRGSIAEAEQVFGSYLIKSGRYAEAEAHLSASYRTLREVRGERALSTRLASRALRELSRVWEQSESATVPVKEKAAEP